MTDKEIKQILSLGKPVVFTIDPNLKTDIQRATLNQLIDQAKRSLSSKHKISLILVKH
jgi:hypothetical protein